MPDMGHELCKVGIQDGGNEPDQGRKRLPEIMGQR